MFNFTGLLPYYKKRCREGAVEDHFSFGLVYQLEEPVDIHRAEETRHDQLVYNSESDVSA